MAEFPAVLILGPRQCGKTTLARYAVEGSYFDLELPSHYQAFAADPEIALRGVAKPVVLDEAQSLPELFPVLRSLIDEHRGVPGRFLLLGSVNPGLLRNISESLAGRVGILDLTPFVYPEVSGEAGVDFAAYWLRGGFPDACLQEDPGAWQRWQEAYVRTFVERDIPRHGLHASPQSMRRFMTMLAHLHGGLLNASELGRAMGVNYHTVQNYLDIAEGHYLVRRLPAWSGNLKKRLVKSPKVYIRDSGVLHHLLGIAGHEALLTSPKRGYSLEGCMIEQIIALERRRTPGAAFSFYRTSAGAEVDLVVERAADSIGYEFKTALSVSRADAAGLRAALGDHVIRQARVVHLGEACFSLGDGVQAMGVDSLLAELKASD